MFGVKASSSVSSTNVKIKQRKAAKITVCAFVILFGLETTVQQWISGSNTYHHHQGTKLSSLKNVPKSRTHPRQSEKSIRNSSLYQDNNHADYSISNAIKIEYEQWHKVVRKLSQMELQPTNWTPVINNWDNHPKERSDRFPSIDERVQYYMGKWYNTVIPMHGRDFEKAIYIQRKSTREYGAFSDILVSLYNLDKDLLLECYHNKKELQVFSPYCRDYIDVAILHSEGTANVLHSIGDGIPYAPKGIQKYPLFAKVRPLCNRGDIDAGDRGFANRLCERKTSVEPILLPLNRRRHFGPTSIVPENDVPWEKKVGMAVWRGQYGKTHETPSDTSDIKYSLVSKHLNSTLVDAKFSKHTKDAPPHMIGSYMDIKDQLRYKYIISIEGNDVSSGLKWMLFSNSVVLTPLFTWEGWAMEGQLKPFQHYIPLKADMSNVEEMIQWAELHPQETRLISERSTLFMYDLLFHPDAIEQEKEIMINIMERFEQNFGSSYERKNGLNIQWNKHPTDRALRFPSVEERVKYAMGKWYRNNDALSMKRSEIKQLPRPILNRGVSRNNVFVADGHQLSLCAMANSTFSNDVRTLCQSSLPVFDERNTADLKSNSFNRLSKTMKGKNMKLADKSSWRHDGKGMKESKRVLLDDSVKLLCFGHCSQNGVNAPFFANNRRNYEDAIVWPFSVDNAVDIVKSGWIKAVDKEFEDKRPKAIWRGGLRSSQKNDALASSNFVSNNVDTATYDTNGISKIFFIPDESSKRKEQVREMLSYRFLLATENDNDISDDILWMLLSQSVVFMPAERRMTSWLMEGFLLPFTHFVPVASDYSDIDEKIRWCEDNREEARMISERATLFVHDMLLDWRADEENEEVKFQVMERYSTLFG